MCGILEEGKHYIETGRCRSLAGQTTTTTTTTTTTITSEGEDQEWSVVSKTQMYDFVWPMGGMFIWLHINFHTHPLYKKVSDHGKLSKALFVHLTKPKYRVLISPGTIFAPSEQIREENAWQYFRVCFAAVDEEDLEGMSRKLVKGIQDFWGLKKVGDIEELVGVGDEVEGGVYLVNLTGIGC